MTRYPTLPESYECAEWRCTLPIDPVAQATGIGFTKPDGSVIRLRLSVDDARHLAASLTDYLSAHDARADLEKVDFYRQVLSDLSEIKRALRWR